MNLKSSEIFGSYYLDKIKEYEKSGFIKDIVVDSDCNCLSLSFYCRRQLCNSSVTIVLDEEFRFETPKDKCILLYAQTIKFVKNLKVLI